MKWYVSQNDDTGGPIDDATVREWVRSGKIAPDAFLRDEAASAWVPLAQTPFAALHPRAAAVSVRPAAPVAAARKSKAPEPRATIGDVIGFIWRAALAVVVLVVVVSVALNMMEGSHASSATSTASPAAASVPTPEQVSLTTLLSEYKGNEVRADNEFKGKLIELNGLVDTIGKDILDKPYVTVGSGAQFEIPVV